MIAEVVAELRRKCGLPADPAVRGPVPLNRFFEESRLPHVEHVVLPHLTRGAVADHLLAAGIEVERVGDPAEPLDGFLFRTDRAAWAFVNGNENNPLVRRRFSAAHELGHAVLHGDRLGRFRADVTIVEGEEPDDDLEREANRFAAELLMPAEVCVARAEELRQEHGCCPRAVLEYRLAAELLVSQQAMRYRLGGLGVGDE